jgi:DNA-binding transcriptional ArsR family regulator
MPNASKQPPNDTALKRAVGHPKRLELLGYLAGKKSGTEKDELAEALGLTPPLVKYHLGVLQSAGLIAPVENQAPGAIDRYIAAASAGL